MSESERSQDQVPKAEPDTYEWHRDRAMEAVYREELDLARAHLNLATELQNAIGRRAQKYLLQKALRERVGNLTEADLARLNSLTEDTVADPISEPEHWHGEQVAPTLRMVPDVRHQEGRLACTTCGVAVMNVQHSEVVTPGWWHLDMEGNPMGPADGHGVTLPS